MNSMMTSTKSSTESLPFSESPCSSVSSFSDSTFFLQNNTQEEEFVVPIDIYHERRGNVEEDKKSRTELNPEDLGDDLYCPTQQHEINNNTTSKGLNTGDFSSLFPQFLPSAFSTNSYGEAMESTKADTWGYNMFNATSNMFGIDGVACQ